MRLILLLLSMLRGHLVKKLLLMLIVYVHLLISENPLLLGPLHFSLGLIHVFHEQIGVLRNVNSLFDVVL